MNSVISDALPLIELFGTFFDKATNSHPHKISLCKELHEFKCVLYTNLDNSTKVDAYLDDLKNKNIIPEQQSNLQDKSNDTENHQFNRISQSSKSGENSPTTEYPMSKRKRAEILTISSFLKYRTISQADKHQMLCSRYSHVQTLDKDPTNLYRVLAISYFTSLLQSPDSNSKLSSIIDDVAAKSIQLECRIENLFHEDICATFCGFFSQLLRMRRAGTPFTKIFSTFLEMIDEDKIYSISLSCFIKSKIYSFVQQKEFPYELLFYKSDLQSDTFKEKVENNEVTIVEYVLLIMPYILDKQIIAHILENGKINEVIYRSFSPKQQTGDDGAIGRKEEVEADAIHLLIEKGFQSLSVFGLFTQANTPFEVDAQSPRENTITSNRNSNSRQFSAEPSTNAIRRPIVRPLSVDTLATNSLRTNYQATLTSNRITEVTDREVAQEKGNLETSKCNELNTKLQVKESLKLKFEKELVNAKDRQKRLYPPVGDTDCDGELSNREPTEMNEEKQTGDNTKRKEVISGSMQRTKYNSSAYRPISATTSPTNASSAFKSTGVKGSQNQIFQKANNIFTGNKINQLRSTHLRTNSYGSYIPIYKCQKETNSRDTLSNSRDTLSNSPSKSENLAPMRPDYHHHKALSSDKTYYPISAVQLPAQNDEYPNTLSDITKNEKLIPEGNPFDQLAIDQTRPIVIRDVGQTQTFTVSNQNRDKLKTLIFMSSKGGAYHIPTSSYSVGNSPTKHHRTYSNLEFHSTQHQDTSPMLNPSKRTVKLYQPISTYAKLKSSYQTSYTPSVNVSRNDSRDLSNSPTRSCNQSPINKHIAGYSTGSSPSRYSNFGDMSQKSAAKGNASPSFGFQLTSLSTNTSFNNYFQAYTKQSAEMQAQPLA